MLFDLLTAEEERIDAVTRRAALFLTGDVMTGRGIDQVLAQPNDPRLEEPYVRDARDYVEFAERGSGPILRPADAGYAWGAALEEFARARPDVRIVNLETSVTTSDAYWPDKGIQYRMHPANVECLSAARLDCCVLANNRVGRLRAGRSARDARSAARVSVPVPPCRPRSHR